MSSEWKDEGMAWYASDLHDLGYVLTQEEWEEFKQVLCDTVVAYLDTDKVDNV